MTNPPSRPWHVTRWAVWSLPARLLAPVLLVEVLAVSLVGAGAGTLPPEALAAAAGAAGTLVLCGVVHAEIALRVERIRRRVTEYAQYDLSSVWTFGAALLLPPVVACAAVVVLYLHLYLRVLRPARVPPHRQLFSTATLLLAVLAAAAAAAVVGGWPQGGPAAVLAAMAAYTLVNTGLVLAAVVLSSDRTVRQVLGIGDGIVLELATMSLGALVAGAYLISGPVLAAFGLVPVLVLHRAVLVRQLRRAADVDASTGLLNAAAWQLQAMRQLERVGRSGGSATLLVLDVHGVERVRDHHGDLAGGMVLSAVAAALCSEVRDRDLVGRFGRAEFMILLSGSARDEHPESPDIAGRIRQRIGRVALELSTPDGPLTITGPPVSAGAATFPRDGVEIHDLMAVADAALRATRRDGHGVVRPDRHHDVEPPRP